MSCTCNICSLDICMELKIFYIPSYLIVIISSHFSVIDHYNLAILFFNSRSVKVLTPIGYSSFILFFMDCTPCIIQTTKSVKFLTLLAAAPSSSSSWTSTPALSSPPSKMPLVILNNNHSQLRQIDRGSTISDDFFPYGRVGRFPPNY